MEQDTQIKQDITDEEFGVLVMDKLKRQLAFDHYIKLYDRACEDRLTPDDIDLIERAKISVDADLRALGRDSSAQLGMTPKGPCEVSLHPARPGAPADRSDTSPAGTTPNGEVPLVAADEVPLRKAKREDDVLEGCSSSSFPARSDTSRRRESSHAAEARFRQRTFVASLVSNPFARTTDIVAATMARFGVSRMTAYRRLAEVREGRTAPHNRVWRTSRARRNG